MAGPTTGQQLLLVSNCLLTPREHDSQIINLNMGLGEGLSKQTFGKTAEQVQLGIQAKAWINDVVKGNNVSHCQ